jgi:hypothetical protein
VRKSHTGQALRPLLNGHAANGNGHAQPNGKEPKTGGANGKDAASKTPARGKRKDAA